VAHPPYERPDWVRRINLMGAGVGGPAAMVRLHADELIGLAHRATGLDDFGDPAWEEPFRRLVTALDEEARLNVLGRLMTRHDVLRHLCTRLLLVETIARDRSITNEAVTAPIVITGPARSGTSIIHELLAEDPSLRAPLGFEMAYPIPASGHDGSEQMAWAEPEFDLWGDVQPEFRAVHELAARLPEECLWLMAPEFDLGFWSTCVDIPSFSGWRAFTDPIPSYRYHRSFLQVLQHDQPRRTWVLKSPLHLSRLATLFAVYPDARVIRTHRDPVRTVPSTVSTVALGRWLRSDAVDPLAVSASVTVGLQMILNNAAHERSSLPVGQVADLHYTDFLRDPVDTIARAYEHLGLPFAPELGSRIARYLEARPQTKYGVHRYRLDDYGLDAERIRRDFAPYVDEFGIEAEDPSASHRGR
jgi:hypothetical protein